MKILTNKYVFNEALANGGITYTIWKDDAMIKLYQTSRTSGYVVSLRKHQLTAYDLTLDLFKAYVKMHAKTIEDHHYIGIWLDTSTGVWYLDVNVITNDRDGAIAFGKLEKQKAIYCLSTGTTITL